MAPNLYREQGLRTIFMAHSLEYHSLPQNASENIKKAALFWKPPKNSLMGWA